ncbi:nuclear mRNA splicing protein [Ephemerocybe angulata]|uniref:Exocyst complex component EXO84 n=1 Tax=Ephemerocybe angulata TaxID=980116 RepID=A0A8H6IKI0_9AGAR|nr:nuclear mRNA splicing protein [Tulosesus angulatus]
MDSLRSRPVAGAPPRPARRRPPKLAKATPHLQSTRCPGDPSNAQSSWGRTQRPGAKLLYGEDRSILRDDAKVAAEDKKTLSAEDFDPDAFLKTKLANSTEAELRSLQSALHNAKNDTAAELQRSVFKNYAEFVLISKEISVLENEMLELKELLSDYKGMPSMLNIPDPTSLTSATLSTYKRSSVADLRILYFNQMQTLHSTIEGAAKFVPTTPGRHVVGEFENVLSLNAATYRIIHKVKFVVLDDAVLVAKRRRRNAGGAAPDGSGSTVNEGKLVAEKCWPLNEMLVLDTKDSANMTNVFKVRHGKETHVYRTESPHEKKQILTLFRQVAEELQQKKRKEREGEHERRKSMWQNTGGGGRNSPAPPMPEWMSELAKKGGDIPSIANDAKEKAERDARFVGDWSDNLTVAIALKEWKKAVDLVEEGQAKSATMPPLAAKLPPLISQLTASLIESLALPSNRKSTVVTIITLLNRLKAGAAARGTFLEMRSKVIHGLMRKIPFEGHAGAYIGELSVVFFTGIKHTADWYLASFRENEVASSFIAWAKQQIEKYCEIFRKQVYSKDAEPKVVDEAIQITHIQSRKLLEEYGLDFKYLLNQLLVPTPTNAADDHASFHVNEHRQSKQIVMAVRSFQQPPSQIKTKASITHLQAAPPPPQLSAPPISRRRTPGPPPSPGASASGSGSGSINSSSNNLPPPIGSAVLRDMGDPSLAAPTPTPTGRSMYRSRTPVSAAERNPPPSAGLASPLPTRRPTNDLHSSVGSNGSSAAGGGGGGVVGYFSSSDRDRERERDRDRGDRPPRSLRGSPAPGAVSRTGTGSPAPVPPPPRSLNRPGSSAGGPERSRGLGSAGVVPQRQGMF